MICPIVENVASTNIISLDTNAVLSEAIKLITEKSIRNVVVHDADADEYAYIGVDEILKCITSNTDPNTSLVKLGLHPLIGIPKDYNIFEASYFFIENESIIGVLNDDGSLFGVISFIDILSATMSINEQIVNAPVSQLVYKNTAFMSNKGVILSSLLSELNSSSTDCIIVHENDTPLGMITKRDVTAMVANGKTLDIAVEECMNGPVFTVDGDITVKEALDTVNKYRYKRILVVDEVGKLQGIITQKELISVIYHRFSHKTIISMDKLNKILEQKVNIKAEELSEIKDRYEYALSASTDGVWDWNLITGQVVMSNQLKKMLRIENRIVCCMHDDYETLIHPDDLDMVLNQREKHLQDQSDIYDLEYRILSGDEYLWVKNRSKIVYFNSQPIRIVSTLSNMTSYKKIQKELKDQKDQLIYQANHDILTSLPNRHQLLEKLNKKIELSKETDSCFAVLFIDLDRFKEINDYLGHIVGDKVLEMISKKLSDSVKNGHLVARFGGDEFVVITDTIEDKNKALSLAQSIIDKIREPIAIDNNTLYVSSSIGISYYPKDAKSSENLLKYADAAMFKAKEDGINSYSLYNSSMTTLAMKKVQLESDLHKALENDEFEVFYQPQYDMKKNTIIGMEALVRWIHPDKGIISPDEFIPIAEQSGLIIKLDQIVMKKAIQQVSKWHKKGLNPGKLALNLAMKHLQYKEFISVLKKNIDKYDFKAELLELEITESQLMKNPEESISKLSELTKMGILISIDDFGTGYSSLAYLKRLPVNKLKIDRSFIMDIPKDEEDMAITSSIVALANSLKLKVIAEGVETNEQVEFLLSIGCYDAQGYFYSRALCADDFEKLLI
jgi:diguanylate cyclase (GGDEF)-like protein